MSEAENREGEKGLSVVSLPGIGGRGQFSLKVWFGFSTVLILPCKSFQCDAAAVTHNTGKALRGKQQICKPLEILYCSIVSCARCLLATQSTQS
jgi:hypothetical protein